MPKSWEQQILDAMAGVAASGASDGVAVALVKNADPVTVSYRGMDYPTNRLLIAERLTAHEREADIIWDNPVLHDKANHGKPKVKLKYAAALTPGDAVFVLQTPDKQQLYVLDKVVRP